MTSASKSPPVKNQPSNLKLPSLFSIILLGIGILPYFANLNGEFIFDDLNEIRENPNIKTLSPISTPMWKVNRLVVRPVPYLTFAINYAVHGLERPGYHLVNISCHFISGILIYLVLSQLFTRDKFPEAIRKNNFTLAWWCSLLWLVHPLQTMPVNYIYQRLELMWSLFFLAAIWGLLLTTSTKSSTRTWGQWLCIISCVLGMASKETMVIAPFFLLLLDYVMLADSWKEIWDKRFNLYLGVFLSYLVLISIVTGQSQSYGENKISVTRWEFLCTESKILLHYFRLVFIPDPLIFDYEWPIEKGGLSACWLQFSIQVFFILLMCYGLWKKYYWSLLLAFVYFVLAPTSSFVPVTHPAMEYRMYLPISSFIIFSLLLGFMLLKQIFRNPDETYSLWGLRTVCVLLFAAMFILNYGRNLDYQTLVSIWKDNIQKLPGNSMGYYQIGLNMIENKKFEEAEYYSAKAAELRKTDPDCWQNLGVAQIRLNKMDDAEKSFRLSIQHLNYPNAVPYYNLGLALREKNPGEAADNFLKAISIDPEYTAAHFYVALILGNYPDSVEEGMKHIEIARKLDPQNPDIIKYYYVIKGFYDKHKQQK